MQLHASIFTIFLAVNSVRGGLIARDDLQRRDSVDACQAVLVALKASAFCSSFVPITDSTSTIFITPTSATTTLTVTAPPCTVTTDAVTTTETETETTTDTVTATVTQVAKRSIAKRAAATTTTTNANAAVAKNTSKTTANTSKTTPANTSKTTPASTSKTTPVTTSKAVSTSKSSAIATPTGKCTIKGVPVQAQVFVCDVITTACLKYVKPKTVSSTTTLPTGTVSVTSTVTNPCETITPTSTATATVTVTTTVTTTTEVPCPQPTDATGSENGYTLYDNSFFYNGPGLGSGRYNSRQDCQNVCNGINGCVGFNFYKFPATYCEFFGRTSCFGQGRSSDFIAGIK